MNRIEFYGWSSIAKFSLIFSWLYPIQCLFHSFALRSTLFCCCSFTFFSRLNLFLCVLLFGWMWNLVNTNLMLFLVLRSIHSTSMNNSPISYHDVLKTLFLNAHHKHPISSVTVAVVFFFLFCLTLLSSQLMLQFSYTHCTYIGMLFFVEMWTSQIHAFCDVD